MKSTKAVAEQIAELQGFDVVFVARDGSDISSRRVEDYRPEGTPVIIDNIVEQIDDLVAPVRGTGWQTSHPGDRTVRQQLHLIFKNNGLPIGGELYSRAYDYIRENY